MKICISCGIKKTLDLFYTRKKSPDGFNNKCKQCLIEKENKRYSIKREEILSKKKYDSIRLTKTYVKRSAIKNGLTHTDLTKELLSDTKIYIQKIRGIPLKKCTRCNIDKSENDFGIRNDTGRKRLTCKACAVISAVKSNRKSKTKLNAALPVPNKTD